MEVLPKAVAFALIFWAICSRPPTPTTLKIAAIDIGSNAIRLQVSRILEYQGVTTFKKLEYVRFPLRLGQDVFDQGNISDQKQEQFVKLMHAYRLLLDLYEVEGYLAYATSAMREAANGDDLARLVRQEVGIDIEIIDGEKEAAFINQAVIRQLDQKPYLHIDVGGGSTELTYIEGGEKRASRSFPIGSVRRLGHHDAPEVWQEMQAWIVAKVSHLKGHLHAVGTGGNINKIFDLASKKPGKVLGREKILALRNWLDATPMEERLNRLRLNPDRADVIVPATDIYLQVMKWAKARGIVVPDVGLKDGMLYHLHERHISKV